MMMNLITEIKISIRSNPTLFMLYHFFERKSRHLVVGKYSDIVIEGFPRSANSYSVHAFEFLRRNGGGKKLKIAHHLHAPAQIKIAYKLGCPVLVLIRNPIDAVASLLLRNKSLSVEYALQWYSNFYSQILPYHEYYILAEFTEITENYNGVIDRLNSKFNTNFCKMNSTNKQEILAYMEEISIGTYKGNAQKYSIPNLNKQSSKASVITAIRKFESELSEAELIYRKVLTFKSKIEK